MLTEGNISSGTFMVMVMPFVVMVMVVLMVMVMLWSLFLGFAALVQLIFVDAAIAYAECLQQAVTLSRQQQCTSQMSDGLLQQLMGQ